MSCCSNVHLKKCSCCQAATGAGLERGAGAGATAEELLVIQRLGSAFAHLGRLGTNVTLVRVIFSKGCTMYS